MDMSPMQIVRYIRVRYLFLWVLISLTGTIPAQTEQNITELYHHHRVYLLKQLLENNEISSPAWKQFVAALFEVDADKAIQTMLHIYPKANDDELQEIIRERVSQYYSARGIYGTASRILKDKDFFEHEIISQWQGRKQEQFGVQVGAFSTRENAQKALQKFSEQYPNTEIIQKLRNGRKFYIVVIGGYHSRVEADKVARILNNKMRKESYFTIQY